MQVARNVSGGSVTSQAQATFDLPKQILQFRVGSQSPGDVAGRPTQGRGIPPNGRSQLFECQVGSLVYDAAGQGSCLNDGTPLHVSAQL